MPAAHTSWLSAWPITSTAGGVNPARPALLSDPGPACTLAAPPVLAFPGGLFDPPPETSRPTRVATSATTRQTTAMVQRRRRRLRASLNSASASSGGGPEPRGSTAGRATPVRRSLVSAVSVMGLLLLGP